MILIGLHRLIVQLRKFNSWHRRIQWGAMVKGNNKLDRYVEHGYSSAVNLSHQMIQQLFVYTIGN